MCKVPACIPMQRQKLKGSSGFKVDCIYVFRVSYVCQFLLDFQKLGVIILVKVSSIKINILL